MLTCCCYHSHSHKGHNCQKLNGLLRKQRKEAEEEITKKRLKKVKEETQKRNSQGRRGDIWKYEEIRLQKLTKVEKGRMATKAFIVLKSLLSFLGKTENGRKHDNKMLMAEKIKRPQRNCNSLLGQQYKVS